MSDANVPELPDAAIEAAATLLLDARRAGEHLDRLPVEMTPAGVDDAYRIQWAGHRLAAETLGPWKVGATTLTAQQILGVDGPFIGRPPLDRVAIAGSEIVLAEWFLGTAAIETEIGLLPRQDLTELPDDPMELAALVDVVPCLELVNSRFADMTVVGAPSLIADNAVASAIVAGEPLGLSDDETRSLDSMKVSLEVDGEEVAAGTGAMALGHPLNVLHHAAGRAIAWGSPISAGELVITGTCTGLVPAVAGTTAVGRFEGSSIEVHFR